MSLLVFATLTSGHLHHGTLKGLRKWSTPVRFSHVYSKPVGTAPNGATLFTSTYRSDALPLAIGEVRFTDPGITFIDFPQGDIAITSFVAEVVDASNSSVPLSDVYNHHYLIFDSAQPNSGVCGNFLTYLFGGGAESRRSPFLYPSPYAVVARDSQRGTWSANFHLLRTAGLPGDANAVRNCIECVYGPGRGCDPGQTGQFACCQDATYCEGSPNPPADTRNYFFQYSVTYSRQVELFKPLLVYVLDASNCQVEFNTPRGSADRPTYEITHSWRAPSAFRMVYAYGHLHISGVNITILIDGRAVCSSAAIYGARAGVVGDELGYVVRMSPCDVVDFGVVPAGANVTVNAVYAIDPADRRAAPFPGGEHFGVMTLMYIAVAPV